MTEVLSSGIMSYTDIEDYKGLVDVYALCYYDSELPNANLFPFMANFDQETFNDELLSQCLDQDTC